MSGETGHTATGQLGYRFSVGFVVRFAISMLLKRPRNAVQDGVWQLEWLGARTQVQGLDHMPASGPCILVMNHYERSGMRVWWAAWAVMTVVATRRKGDSVRWMITDRFYNYRVMGVPIPERVMRWFLLRVASTYGLLQVSRVDAGGRGGALRSALRVLRREDGVVGVTPEAGNGGDGMVLVRPVEGSTSSMSWLSRGEVPIVPVGVFEDAEGVLVIRFGAPFTLHPDDLHPDELPADRAYEDILSPVAHLLPEELRGPYSPEGHSHHDETR